MLNTPFRPSVIGLHTRLDLDEVGGDYMRLVKPNIILYITSCDEGVRIKLLRAHFAAGKVVMVGVELDPNANLQSLPLGHPGRDQVGRNQHQTRTII